jgi:hypothetical protein
MAHTYNPSTWEAGCNKKDQFEASSGKKFSRPPSQQKKAVMTISLYMGPEIWGTEL